MSPAVNEDPGLEATLALADTVVSELNARGLDVVLIGGLALAVHGYPRDTEDLDLAVAVDPAQLREVGEALSRRGLEVKFLSPDASDPLGGVLDVRRPGAELVQVVNFANPPAGGFPRLVLDSLPTSSELVPGGKLRVVDPYHLIAFKLYAGGAKARLDVLELLDRHPELDRLRLGEMCASYRLSEELERVLELEREEEGS